MAQHRETIETDLNAALSRQETLSEQAKAYAEKLRRAREEVDRCQNADAGYALRMKSRVERRDSLQKSLDTLRIELQTNRSRAKMLQELQRDYEGFSKAVRLVMQEARSGRLGRIYGPVSSLLRTQDAYTVAIETALGGAMQNIVVDSEADGKAAIRFLKRCDGGRATFPAEEHNPGQDAPGAGPGPVRRVCGRRGRPGGGRRGLPGHRPAICWGASFWWRTWTTPWPWPGSFKIGLRSSPLTVR